MVFIGDDTDFVPIEPWPRSNTDVSSGKMQEAWDAITGKITNNKWQTLAAVNVTK